ncbi:MAG: S49 family peptidase [Gammaproteobacteria bacterium]
MANETTESTPTGSTLKATREDAPGWEREALFKLATAGLEEQRRTRRWGIFFKLLGFAYLFILLFMLGAFGPGPDETGLGGRHTALVELEGLIAADAPASAENVIAGLRAAFDDRQTAGVILRVNSPGGSPVQAGYINDEISRLRKQHPDVPLHVVISDVCASGGLYAAVAADKIFANEASLVGSIGVRIDSFGFVEALNKLGVERRLYTAGEHKGMLDPFLPQEPAERAHVQAMLDEIHRQFIDVVKAGRGERLTDERALFSGLIWSGERAMELGLVDEMGNAAYVAREVIGAEKIVDFTHREDYLQWFADRLGTALAREIEARLLLPGLR